MRDKLIELINGMFDGDCCIDVADAADYLIANGVTFVEDNNVSCKKPVLYSVTRGALCPKCDGELDFQIVQGGAFKQKVTTIRRKVAFCHLCGQPLDWGNEPPKEGE